MTFAEALSSLRSDGYHDAADLLEEQAHQILIFRQAMLENEALKKQLKVTMEDLAYYKQELSKVRNQHADSLTDRLFAEIVGIER